MPGIGRRDAVGRMPRRASSVLRAPRAFCEPIAHTVVLCPSLSWRTRLPFDVACEMPGQGSVTSRTTLVTTTSSAPKRMPGRTMTQNDAAARAKPTNAIVCGERAMRPLTTRTIPMATPNHPMTTLNV